MNFMIESIKIPKYSIVIPTRNREEYLPFAIDSVLSQKRDDIELIVSDNYSKDGTLSYLETLIDHRLVVVKPLEELPMSSHYEYILSKATGEWVTILGDDDAVMPYLFDRLDSIIENYPDTSIISSERAYYFWEDCEDLYGDLVVLYTTGGGIEVRSTKKDLLWTLAGLRSCFDMPMIYTSCMVKNSLIKGIKDMSGGYFYHSIIPDIYSIVALSLVEDFYVRVEEPLFWVGTSNKSMGRSDRIYRDSEMHVEYNNFKDETGHDLKLNKNISQELHSAGFSSYYIYESLKQCPFAKKQWTSQFLTTVVFASLRLMAIEVNINKIYFSDIHLIKKINIEIKRNGISIYLVVMIYRILYVIRVLNRVKKIPARVWAKLTKRSAKNKIVSHVREDYPSIKDASDKILKMKFVEL